ncbi:hypothetical protein C8Q74DRAFT_661576 [Fomes fomentarius]|nr:hypothetical protein C8Q74DRAFT_661576 [Fomes fomentarius]
MVDVITVNLVGGFLECTLFGIFLMLSSAAFFLLASRHHAVSSSSSNVSAPRRWIAQVGAVGKSPLFVVNILFILTVSIHFVLTADRLIAAVVRHGGGEATAAFLIDLQERTQIARLAILFVDMFLGDVVVTYRVWTVWGHALGITVFPIFTVIGVVVAGSGMIHSFLTTQTSADVFNDKVGPWVTAICVMTVCTNVYSTVIAWRIWKSNQVFRGAGVLNNSQRIFNALTIFVESASLWTICVIIYLFWYLTGSPLEGIGSGCCPVMVGITFTSISVRVGLRRARGTKPITASAQCALPPFGSSRSPMGRARNGSTSHHALQSTSGSVAHTHTVKLDEEDVLCIGHDTKEAFSLPHRLESTLTESV